MTTQKGDPYVKVFHYLSGVSKTGMLHITTFKYSIIKLIVIFCTGGFKKVALL